MGQSTRVLVQRCPGLVPSIRHFENRRGEGPGDEVGWTVSETFRTLTIFVDKILAFEAKEPLIPPMISPFTLKRLVSDDFYLWERKCWNFLLCALVVKNHFADCRTAACPWCENSKKRGKTERGIGHCRNVRELGKSMVVFRLFEKLWCSNERSTKFGSLYHE